MVGAPGDVRGRAGRSGGRSARGAGRTLALFLGSNIGNFDPPGADAFLRGVRAALDAGDALLLGADLVKPEARSAARLRRSARRDRGVQPQSARADQPRARRRLRRLASSTTARSGTRRSRASRCTSSPDPSSTCASGAASLELTFDAGETIWTESSYKYRPEGVVGMLERAGFRLMMQWTDEAGGFALTLVEAS